MQDDDRTDLPGEIAEFLIRDDLQSMVIVRNAWSRHHSRLSALRAFDQ